MPARWPHVRLSEAASVLRPQMLALDCQIQRLAWRRNVMEKRFRALRTVGTIYKIVGIIVALLTILGAIGVCLGGVLSGGVMQTLSQNQDWGTLGGLLGPMAGSIGTIVSGALAVGGVIYGAFAAITLYAVGELIDLLVALEENTRSTALLLRQQAAPPAKTPEGS